MESFTHLIEAISGNLSEVAQSDIVVGQPIEKGSVTIIPLSKVSVGYGGGGGEGEGGSAGQAAETKSGKGHGRRQHQQASGKGSGGGAGGGAKVSPVGVVVFSDEGVKIEPIKTRHGAIDKIFDKIPELIDMAKDAKENKTAVG